MKRHLSGRSLALIILLVLFAVQIGAQEKLDLQMVQRIRTEGLENSKIMDFMIYLCEVYGPRLPASPQYLRAGEWVVGKAKELGLENAMMESYGTFGRSWELQKFYAAMTAPQYMPIIGYSKAWTPGTKGLLKGNAVLLNVTKVADLDKYKGKLKDAIVLTQGPRDLPISFDPSPNHRSPGANHVAIGANRRGIEPED